MKELLLNYSTEIYLTLVSLINIFYMLKRKKEDFKFFIIISYLLLFLVDFKFKESSFIFLIDVGTFFILYLFYLNEKFDDFVNLNFFIFAHLLSIHLILKTETLYIFFLALELLSFVFYILLGLEAKKFKDLSPLIRYFVIGSVSSLIMLFSLILIFSQTGDLTYKALTLFDKKDPIFRTGIYLFIFSLGFKILFVPFQFFMPDVFEKIKSPYILLISLTPKAGILVFLYKIKFFLPEIVFPVSIFAISTILISNLAGIYENKVKRIIAYSTISHSGFMFMAILLPEPYSKNVLLFYLLIYFLMKGGFIFSINYFLNENKDVDINELKGTYFTDKLISISSMIFILSLISFPPTGGFFAKFYLIYALFKFDHGIEAFILIILTIISVGYYIKFLNSFFLEPARKRERLYTRFFESFNLILAFITLFGFVFLKFFI